MAKYDENFKLLIINEYLEGKLGCKLLAQKYDVKSYSQIERWVKIYERFGEEGLKRKRQKSGYSVQFKVDVLSFMKRTGASIMETALQFGLTNPSMIVSWNKAFLEGGTEGLDKPKGRPPMSDKAKNKRIGLRPILGLALQPLCMGENS